MALQLYNNNGIIIDQWPKNANTGTTIIQGPAPTRYTAVFALDGILAVTTGKLRIYNITGATRTITEVSIAVDTAPVGAAIIVDVNKNGTTIFTVQANRPQIASGSNFGFTTVIDDNSFADGDYLQMDADAVGSSNAGAYLTVHITYF